MSLYPSTARPNESCIAYPTNTPAVVHRASVGGKPHAAPGVFGDKSRGQWTVARAFAWAAQKTP